MGPYATALLPLQRDYAAEVVPDLPPIHTLANSYPRAGLPELRLSFDMLPEHARAYNRSMVADSEVER